MALQINPNLYTGGNERVDSRPHVALYARLMEREQARNDAFDQYFRNLNKNINPAGMRNQEREVFEDKLKQWQQYGVQNKETIHNPRKDRGEASMNFQAGYQDLMNLVAESKQKEEMKKPWVEIYSDPNKRDRVNHEQAMQSLAAHDAGLFERDPNTGQWVRNQKRRDFNITDIDFDPKPHEPDKFFKGLEDIKPSESFEKVTARDPKSLTQTVTTTSRFTQDDYDKTATRAVSSYGNDKGFKKYIDDLYKDPNAKEVLKYNETFKNIYGHDISSPGDLAAAYAIEGKSTSSTTSKLQDDKMAQFTEQERQRQVNREKNMRKANDYIMSRQAYRDSKNAKIVDEYVQSQFNDPTSTEGVVSNDGKQYKGRFVKVPAAFVDKYSVNKGTKEAPNWVDPQFFMTDDGKYVIPVYRSGTKSKSGWDDVYKESKPINMADWKIQISNDWIKNNRTANELADEFDVEGEVNESSSETKVIKKGQKTYRGLDANGLPIYR